MARTDLGDALVVRLEADLKNFEAGMDKATKRVQVFDKTASAGSAGAAKFARSTDTMTRSAKNAGGGMGELRESFASLVSQMAGVHPVSGKLLSVFGSLALGSGVMIGVLGGLAALGAAFRFLTRDITEAREASEKNLETLAKLADKARGGEISELNKGIVEGQARQAAIATQMARIQSGTFQDKGKLRELQLEYDELTFRIGLATTRIKELEQEKIKANNETHAKSIAAQATAHAEAAKAIELHHGALVALVDAGVASQAQTAELQKIMSGWADAALDASKGTEAQAEALRNLLSALSALRTEAAKTGGRLPLLLPSTSGTVLAPGLPASGASGAQAHEFVFGEKVEKLADSTDLLQGAFDNLFGALKAQLPDFMSAGLSNPLSLFGNVAGMLIGGVTDIFSRRSADRRRVRELEQELAMRDVAAASRRAAAEMNNFATAMRNVPLTFNTAFASYRVGMSGGSASASMRAANSGVTITGDVNVYPTDFADFERSVYDAAGRGNQLARSLVRR